MLPRCGAWLGYPSRMSADRDAETSPRARAKEETTKRPLVTGLLLLVVAPVAVYLAFDVVNDWFRRVLREEIETALRLNSHDINRERARMAANSSAEFVNTHLAKVTPFPDRFALLEHSLKSVGVKGGLYCEFGVFKGESINFIASKTSSTVHGFDSFEGLPEDWRTGFNAGAFGVDGLPKVRPNVKLHKGWFDKSIPVWAKDNTGPLAFAHLDADLYSSTKMVFDLLGDRIVVGTVLQFDEFFNYPDWQNGEYKAFQELVAGRRLKFEYIGFAERVGMQVAVKILEVGTAAPTPSTDAGPPKTD